MLSRKREHQQESILLLEEIITEESGRDYDVMLATSTFFQNKIGIAVLPDPSHFALAMTSAMGVRLPV